MAARPHNLGGLKMILKCVQIIGSPCTWKHKVSVDLSCRTRRSSCFRFINSCEQIFREVIMKPTFVFRGLYQSFEEQFSYNAIPKLPLY